MARIAASVGALLVFLLTGPERLIKPLTAAAAVDDDQHAYFNALVARGDHWKSFSLRDARQLTYKNQGGYSDTSSSSYPNTLYVTYRPEADTDVQAQDAAKVVIPSFRHYHQTHTLSAGIDAAQTSFSLTDIPSPSIFWNGGTGRRIKIGSEIMEIATLPDNATNTLTVKARGVDGTTAQSHSAGASVLYNTNSLPSQVLLPLGTADGNTYLFTWDAYWTASYLNSGLTNHKVFQFASAGVWFEPQTGFDGAGKSGFSQSSEVAVLTARTYNLLGSAADWLTTDGDRTGPGLLTTNYITPRLAMPTIYAGRWTRFWVRVDQRANDYDRVSMWMADEQQEPVIVYRDLLLSVRPKTNRIDDFWVEFNTSTDRYTRGGGQRDLVAYVKNFVALRNPSDVGGLLLRPTAGIPPTYVPQQAPVAPSNLRIIR